MKLVTIRGGSISQVYQSFALWQRFWWFGFILVAPWQRIQMCFRNDGYQMMYWAVPVFFIITGVLLLNPSKSITATDCIWKYEKRIVLALLIFGIPFAILKLVMENGVSIEQ